MEALILTVFISVVLSALGVALFVWDVRQGGPDHHDRLSLLPLESGPQLPSSQAAQRSAEHTNHDNASAATDTTIDTTQD